MWFNVIIQAPCRLSQVLENTGSFSILLVYSDKINGNLGFFQMTADMEFTVHDSRPYICFQTLGLHILGEL